MFAQNVVNVLCKSGVNVVSFLFKKISLKLIILNDLRKLKFVVGLSRNK